MPVDAESARTFAKFDTDGSGSISWRELHEMLKEIGLDGDAPHAKAVLARYDKNHDGTLNLAEFDGLVKTISYAAGADATVRGIAPTVLAVFRKYDTDGNGTLSGAEFGAVLRELGLPDSERDAMLARYDRDGDRVITLNELNNLIADAMAAFSY